MSMAGRSIHGVLISHFRKSICDPLGADSFSLFPISDERRACSRL